MKHHSNECFHGSHNFSQNVHISYYKTYQGYNQTKEQTDLFIDE